MTPRSVELVSAAQYYAGLSDPPKSAGCDTLCQRLLLSGRVDIVRVTRKSTEWSGEIDHVIELRNPCPEAFGPNEPMLPETKDALVSGRCFISRVASAEPMMARIEIENSKFPAPQNLGQDFARAVNDVRSLRVLKISAASPGGSSLLDQMEARNDSHFSGMIGSVIARLDGKYLHPRGDRILALIMNSDWRWVGASVLHPGASELTLPN